MTHQIVLLLPKDHTRTITKRSRVTHAGQDQKTETDDEILTSKVQLFLASGMQAKLLWLFFLNKKIQRTRRLYRLALMRNDRGVSYLDVLGSSQTMEIYGG